MKKTLSILLFFTMSSVFTTTWAWQLDKKQSYIKFFIKSMLDNVNGRFHNFGVANVKITGDNATGTINVNVSSIDTKNKKRDTHLRHEDFFFVKKYPLAKIQINKIEKSGSQHIAHTSITIRGITRKKRIKVAITQNKKLFVAKGSVVINRKKFGVKYGVFYNPIEDNARIDFKIALIK